MGGLSGPPFLIQPPGFHIGGALVLKVQPSILLKNRTGRGVSHLTQIKGAKLRNSAEVFGISDAERVDHGAKGLQAFGFF